MNKQQQQNVMLKLATVRLAINHVLRSRAMQKEAEGAYDGIKPEYRYIEALEQTLNNSPNNISRGDVSIAVGDPYFRGELSQIAREASQGKLSQEQINARLQPFYNEINGVLPNSSGEDVSAIFMNVNSTKPFDKSIPTNITKANIRGVPAYPVSSDTAYGLPEARALGWVHRTNNTKWNGHPGGEEVPHESFFGPKDYEYQFGERP